MKHILIKKTLVLYVALIATAVLGACSNDSDPQLEDMNLKFKGVVNSEMLSGIARGEISIIAELDSIIVLEKELNSTSDWYELKGIKKEGVNNLKIIDGYSWKPMSFLSHCLSPILLYFPWEIYCEKTGFNKTITILSRFEYDPVKQQVTINNNNYDIEKAEDNALTISYTQNNWENENILQKRILRYTILKNSVSTDNYMLFNSENEAKLSIVRMMREYFGDFVNVNDYLPEKEKILYPIINLALMEEDLINGRYTETRTHIYMDDEDSTLHGS